MSQEGSRADGTLKTRFKFVEVDENGEPLGEAREFEIEGEHLYVDAWVVKFSDQLVETGDPLGATSLCLFRRMFGEHQKPSEGFEVDVPFERPGVYGGDEELTSFERDLWDNFWDLANDPEKAKELGVRAAHGEAPSMQLRKNHVYRLTLRASGGLSFETEKLPSVVDH